MKEQIGRIFKESVNKLKIIGVIGGAFLVIISLIDYVQKWGVINSLWEFLLSLWSVFKTYPQISIIILFFWLFVLTVFIIKRSPIKKEITSSEARILEKITGSNAQEIERIKKELLATTKKELTSSESRVLGKITNLETKTSRIRDELDVLEMDVNELEIIRYTGEGKQGAISVRIILLKKAIEKDWDWRISRCLVGIRDYVKVKTIRSSINLDLEKTLVKIEGKAEFKSIIEEIRSLKEVIAD